MGEWLVRRGRLADSRYGRLWRRDDGSASLEFLTTGVLLLVPLVLLVLTLAQIQTAVLGTEGAARHSARLIADDPLEGRAAADRAVRVAFADAGLDLEQARVVVTCAPVAGDCGTPRGSVTVRIDTAVPLPFVPPLFDLDVGLSVPISARATQPVSAFGNAP